MLPSALLLVGVSRALLSAPERLGKTMLFLLYVSLVLLSFLVVLAFSARLLADLSRTLLSAPGQRGETPGAVAALLVPLASSIGLSRAMLSAPG